jgi:hypothetical protein
LAGAPSAFDAPAAALAGWLVGEHPDVAATSVLRSLPAEGGGFVWTITLARLRQGGEGAPGAPMEAGPPLLTCEGANLTGVGAACTTAHVIHRSELAGAFYLTLGGRRSASLDAASTGIAELHAALVPLLPQSIRAEITFSSSNTGAEASADAAAEVGVGAGAVRGAEGDPPGPKRSRAMTVTLTPPSVVALGETLAVVSVLRGPGASLSFSASAPGDGGLVAALTQLSF